MARLMASPPSLAGSRTFTKNETYTIPAGITVLTTVSGKGAPGHPASAGQIYYNIYRTTRVNYDSPAWGTDNTMDNGYQGTVFDAPPPSDYCTSTYFPEDHATVTACFYHYPGVLDSPATVGASSTGFGKTFPGGNGGPASITTFTNVAVVSGDPYNIVVPTGGEVTINF